MAEPILLNLPPRDARDALYRRLENAPQDHAEALLATYDILQGLQDQGVLELLKGALGSSEKVLEILIDTGNSPEVVRAIRNLMILVKTLDAVEPELLESLQRAVPASLAETKTSRSPALLHLLKRISSKDTLRALVFLADLLQALGRGLGPSKTR